MASVTLAASSNTVVTTGWTNPTNAYGTSADGTLATASPAKNATVNSDYGFASFGLPAGAVISSVVINVGWKLSATGVTGETLGVQGRNNGVTDSAAEVTDTTDTTTATKTFTFGTLPSVTDLNTAGRVVARVRCSKGNTTTALTGSLDFVSMTVTYTVTDVIVPNAFKATSAITAVLNAAKTVRNALINASSHIGSTPLYPSTSLFPATDLYPSLGHLSITKVAGGGGTKNVTPATINATSGMTATVNKLGAVKGTINATSTVSAAVKNFVPIAPATINATSAMSAALRALRAVKPATVNATSTVSGVLNVVRSLKVTTVNATSSVTAGLTLVQAITPATANATSSVTATVRRLRGVSATASATSSVTASLAAQRAVRAAITATSTITAALSRQFSLGVVTATATSTVANVTLKVGRFLSPAGDATGTLNASGFATNTMNPAPIDDPVLIAAGTGGVLDPSTTLYPGTGLFPADTGSSMSAATTSTGSMVPA